MNRTELNQILEPIHEDMGEFDRILDGLLQSESALIAGVVRHLLEKKGKRIRPAISFLISRTAGLDHPKMVQAALAIELIHTATLLHDDVVDESDTRRGQKTVNYQWSNLVAVLMGDFFFAKAFRLLAGVESADLIEQVSRATEKVSIGELRQIEESGNWKLDEEEYYNIIRDKTAALFSVSSASCAILNKQTRDRVGLFSDFGNSVGTAFQIADDILDMDGDSSKTGKGTGLDLLQGKITLPLIYTLREGSPAESERILNILNNGLEKGHLDMILKTVKDSGGIDYAHSRAAHYGDSALSFISTFPASACRESLENLIRFSINRDN